jgi:hypothetical protein
VAIKAKLHPFLLHSLDPKCTPARPQSHLEEVPLTIGESILLDSALLPGVCTQCDFCDVFIPGSSRELMAFKAIGNVAQFLRHT